MKTILIFILLALLFSACTKEEPDVIQPGYQFACVPDSVPTDKVCYFQVSFGDTTDGLSLVDIDTTLIIGATVGGMVSVCFADFFTYHYHN